MIFVLPTYSRARLARLACVLALWTAPLAGMAAESGLDPKSPEYAALALAAPDIRDDDFEIRDDYWSGVMTGEAGKAIRLQFFKGNTYKLFFATGSDEIPKGTKVFLKVLSADNVVVAESEGQKGSATAVKIEPPATGLYLVLMRVEVEGDADRPIETALFYGYK